MRRSGLLVLLTVAIFAYIGSYAQAAATDGSTATLTSLEDWVRESTHMPASAPAKTASYKSNIKDRACLTPVSVCSDLIPQALR